MTDETAAVLGELLARLLPQLDERQRRLTLGAAARVLGFGGVRRVARLAEVASPHGAITVTTPDQLAAIAGHTLTPDKPTKSSK